MTILKLLWPFVWEVLLGDQTVAQAIRVNKKRLLLFILVISLIFTASWSVMRLVTLGRAYVELQHSCIMPTATVTEGAVHPAREQASEPIAISPITKPDGNTVETDEALKSQLLSVMRHQK